MEDRRKKMKKHTLILMLLSVCFWGALAHDALSRAYLDPDIEQGIEIQHNSIEDGVRWGRLTRDEARLLKNNLHQIQDEAMRLQADGRLSQREKERLMAMLHENSAMIEDKRRNPIKDVTLAGPAPRDPEIRDRIAEQQRRINRGIESGNLALNEAKVLDGNLNYIREEETRLRADGMLDGWERNRLLRMLNNNAEMIQDKKNNPIVGYGRDIALDDRAYSIPQRIANQQYKINNGIRAGELTQREATALEENLDFIQKEEARLRSRDGLDDRERERLHTLLDQNGAMIFDKKRNPIREFR